MAEQIRSFWSHLCGIFGAIFGMIAGGTLVTIEQADASSMHLYKATTPNCRESQYYKELELTNGAVIYGCYGGGWFCGEANRSVYSSMCGSLNPCYILGNYDQYPRTYAFFKGCADGYYSTEGTSYKVNPTISSTVSSAIGAQMHKALTSLRNVTSVVGVNPFGGQERCTYPKGSTVSTSAGRIRLAFATNALGDDYHNYYDIDVDALTDGKCAKCPSYGEYAARSGKGGYTASVATECFMTSTTPRHDAADQPDGVATGQFIWTNLCFHDGDTATYLAPACRNKVASGPCSISLASYSNKSSAVAWVTEVCGGTASCKSMANSVIGATTLPWKFKLSVSCDAAKCYKEAAAADGVNFSYRDESYVSPTPTPTPGANASEIFDIVKEIIYAGALPHITEDDITMDSDLYADLSMDELQVADMVNAIEDEFDVNVPDTVFTKWQTVRDVVDWIERNMALSM